MSCLLLELSAPKVNAFNANDMELYGDDILSAVYGFGYSYSDLPYGILSADNSSINGTYNGRSVFKYWYVPNNSYTLTRNGNYLQTSPVICRYVRIRWSGSAWVAYSNPNDSINNGINVNIYCPNNSNYSSYIKTNGVTLLYNGDTIIDGNLYELVDNVSFYNSGTYDFNFDVMTTENSVYLVALASYVTHRYIASIDFTVTNNGNTQNITYQFPTYYTYFPYKSSGMPTALSSDPDAPLWYKIISQETVDDFTRTFSSIGAVYLPPVVFDGTEQLEWSSDEANLFAVHNKWTLRQIFDTLSIEYPTFITQLSDLFISYHYSVFDLDVLVNGSPTLVIEGTLDYSGAKEEDIPQDDPNITNLTKTVENVYNQIGGVQYMMSTLTGKSTYSFKSYEKNGLPDFQSINNPEYHYDDVELDSDSMSWFSWLVEYLYLRSPIGIFLTLALGVLVCRMVLW